MLALGGPQRVGHRDLLFDLPHKMEISRFRTNYDLGASSIMDPARPNLFSGSHFEYGTSRRLEHINQPASSPGLNDNGDHEERKKVWEGLRVHVPSYVPRLSQANKRSYLWNKQDECFGFVCFHHSHHSPLYFVPVFESWTQSPSIFFRWPQITVLCA